MYSYGQPRNYDLPYILICDSKPSNFSYSHWARTRIIGLSQRISGDRFTQRIRLYEIRHVWRKMKKGIRFYQGCWHVLSNKVKTNYRDIENGQQPMSKSRDTQSNTSYLQSKLRDWWSHWECKKEAKERPT